MIKLVCLLLLLSVNTFAKEGAGGHGGDPFAVYAEDYPDQKKLDQGLLDVLDKVRATNLPESFKKDIEDELFELKINNLFLYLESLLIVEVESPDTYRLPHDLKTFTSLGAMTSHLKGSPVYLSKKTLTYDREMFGKILLHEILHHVLIDTLSSHEDFVDFVVTSVWENSNSEMISRTIDERVYIVPGGMISVWQIFGSKFSENYFYNWCKRKDISGSRSPDDTCKESFTRAKDYLRKNLPFNNSEATTSSIREHLEVAMGWAARDGRASSFRNQFIWSFSKTLGHQIKFENARLAMEYDCKKFTGRILLGKCIQGNELKVKDFFLK